MTATSLIERLGNFKKHLPTLTESQHQIMFFYYNKNVKTPLKKHYMNSTNVY